MSSRLFNSTRQNRSKMLRNNILLSGVLKIVGLSCSLLIVPVTLDYLNNEVYGIWLTMSSILYWFTFFDVGLGNGMRNYLTKAISSRNFQLARSYLSTTLILLSLIAVIVGVIAIVPMTFLNLNKVFNTNEINGNNLREALLVATVFTLVMFVVKNIGYVFVGLQKYAVNNLLLVSGNVISLVIIYILARFTAGNLLYVVMAFTIPPALVFIVASIPIFKIYPELRPSFAYFDKKLVKQIVAKGISFFFIQITSCLVLYGSSNLFITQYCGPKSVTVYNIAYKFFNLLAIGYTIIISPMWNAYTDAYVKGDMAWIEKTFNRAMAMWGLTIIGGAIMLLFCHVFYSLWIGTSVVIPFDVSVCVFAFISMFNLNNGITYLLNGLNKIRVQIYTSIVVTVVYLAILILYGRKIGLCGILLCMAVAYASMCLVHFYQCRLLISQRARGIWNK